MPVPAGTRIGPYEVVGAIGAGGMGEVYRARDTRLGREVALKTLPSAVAADADRLRRFEQEARSTGQLNHPNILAVYDVGAHDGSPYVVSELLEGETLRERIGGAALPARKAIEYAVQIARGLAAAHDKGIVHRDLKPENIFVTRDGRVKILDFGLAKLLTGDGAGGSEVQTFEHAAGTDAGTVMGTVGYMSPEQVRARPVDHRSDIFSFGAVLYEMLSGQRAFRGASSVETMNAILKEDPPALTAANRQLPPALERIVGHCLEKNPDERFQSARDVAFDLEHLSTTSAAAPVGADGRRRRLWPALAAVAAVAGVAAGYLAGRQQASPEVVFHAVTFQNGWAQDARFAPDGKQILYQARWSGMEPDVYVAQRGSPESRPLGVKAQRLFGVSAAGDLLIRRSERHALAQAPMGGGAPRDLLADVEEASWSPDAAALAVLHDTGARMQLEYPLGKVVHESSSMKFPRVSPTGDAVAFSEHPLVGDFRGDIAIVDAAGHVSTLSAGWSDIRGLTWSPDGREVWFTATKTGADNSLWAVSRSGRLRSLFRAPGSLSIHDVGPDGRVLLTVQRRKPRILGRGPGDSAERDLSWLDYGNTADISRDGRTLLFGEQGEGGGSEYAAYIRGMDGSLPVRLGKGLAAALSPDGSLALVISLTLPMQAVLLPTGAGTQRPLPRGPIEQIQAASFLPDGRRIVLCASEPGKGSRLYLQDVQGGDPRPIGEVGSVYALNSTIPVTPDGAFIVISDKDGRLGLHPVAGGPVREVASSRPGDRPLQVSGDGRWLFVDASGAAGQEAARGASEAGRIDRIDLASGVREPWLALTGNSTNPAAFVGNVVLSADGRSYAYTYRDDSSILYVAEGIR
ncbi:MAG: protein kinase [Vicinamibacteria bacterium]